MTTHELARQLLARPDVMAVVAGYEGGANEVRSILSIHLRLNVNDAWYYGTHEEASDGASAVMIA